MKLRLTRLVIGIICLGSCFFVSAQSIFIDSFEPPPGFEPAHVSQHLRVSVFFLHQHIGFFYINIHQGQLKFNSPEHLVAQLVGIKEKKSILRLLSQTFPLNIGCLPNGVVALPSFCEHLRKEPVYIIYDPQEETVNLFLSPVYFKKPATNNCIDFIPYSTAHWSYINKLGAAGAFSGGDSWSLSQIYPSLINYYNIYSNNVVAYGNNSLIGNMSQNNGIDDGEHFQIQNLYAQNITRDKVYTAGYIINPVSPFFQTQIIAGAGIKTTLETVRNVNNITATPLVIFVPQASQVSIFKNEQLIFSQYLAAGYQTINTSNFPDGGYELTIKIGSDNIMRRFFTKGFFLPPIQAPQFYIIGGYLTNAMILANNNYNFLPKVLDVPVLQAGLNKRITQKLALEGDILLESNQGLFDFGPTFFWGNSLIKTTGLITSKSNFGFYTMINTQYNRLNFNLIATKIFYQNKKLDYYFLNNLSDNDSLSLSYRLSPKDLLGVQSNYTKILEQPSSYGVGTYYQRQLGFYKGISFFFNASYNQTFYVGHSYYAGLSMNFSQGRLAGTEALLWQNQNKNTYHNQLALPLVTQGGTTYSHQNEVGIGHSFNETHTISPTVNSLAGTYNYTAPHGFVSAYMNHNQIRKERGSIGYGGSLETEMALNQNGFGFNGVERGNAAGIIVRVLSSNVEDKSAKFALLDSYNRKIAVIPINQKVFVSLPGFTDQNYTLINLSDADYSIKDPTQHMTLYPGNVGYYTWVVEKRVIVIGRFVSKDGNHPLANKWIHVDKNGVYSDEEGYFQLELPQNITSLTVEGLNACQIRLPKLNVGKNYLYIGDVSCF